MRVLPQAKPNDCRRTRVPLQTRPNDCRRVRVLPQAKPNDCRTIKDGAEKDEQSTAEIRNTAGESAKFRHLSRNA